jgi:hypothetical protein
MSASTLESKIEDLEKKLYQARVDYAEMKLVLDSQDFNIKKMQQRAHALEIAQAEVDRTWLDKISALKAMLAPIAMARRHLLAGRPSAWILLASCDAFFEKINAELS